MTNRWKINNTDIFTAYGVYIFRANYNDLLAPPTPRRRLEHEYTDRDGVDVDTFSPLTYEPKRFTIKVGIRAFDADDFWSKYDMFFSLISQPGSFELYIEDLDRTFTLLYEGVTKAEKLTPFYTKAGNHLVSATFDIKLLEPIQPTLPALGSGADLLIVNNGVTSVVNNASDAFVIIENKLYLNL